MNHNVVVECENKNQHLMDFCTRIGDNAMIKECQFIGQFFKITPPAKKISYDISKRLVDGIREKENIKRYEKNYEKKMKQKKHDQENWHRQIPVGDSIINLEVVKVDV